MQQHEYDELFEEFGVREGTYVQVSTSISNVIGRMQPFNKAGIELLTLNRYEFTRDGFIREENERTVIIPHRPGSLTITILPDEPIYNDKFRPEVEYMGEPVLLNSGRQDIYAIISQVHPYSLKLSEHIGQNFQQEPIIYSEPKFINTSQGVDVQLLGRPLGTILNEVTEHKRQSMQPSNNPPTQP